ncbi:hypothetical protein POVWA1_011920 [Plasmodium ovale wallikeri]|uniref:Uncharacterized protein n=1 Tax=Plasmodium ovale wallikeri TaxID=864142 RepID=A0A1A8YLX7_PLAOA|nr:hypothetical protein POVWA1_011920 [Plasmodium ovale wallikeri]
MHAHNSRVPFTFVTENGKTIFANLDKKRKKKKKKKKKRGSREEKKIEKELGRTRSQFLPHSAKKSSRRLLSYSHYKIAILKVRDTLNCFYQKKCVNSLGISVTHACIHTYTIVYTSKAISTNEHRNTYTYIYICMHPCVRICLFGSPSEETDPS